MSGHYLKAESPRYPNGQILHYTKGCQLASSTLPEEAREAHILPGLEHISLISIGKFCDYGCEASFNHHNMSDTKYEQVLLKGTRDIMTGLWRVPFQSLDISTNQRNQLHQFNGKEKSNKYLHAA